MKAQKRILICGASIAGPCLAYWLHKYGYSVVIIEKAPSLRDGGQNVDIKGVGQQVMKLMAVDEKITAMNTQERGQRYVDASGNVVASFPKGALGGLTSSYEILRGDLAQILCDATKDVCEYRFGTFLTAADERDDYVRVTFNDGSTEDFELIVCAEGFGSSTRKLVMDDNVQLKYLGAYMSFFRIPKTPDDDLWAKTYNGTGGLMITLRPGHGDTTVLVTFLQRGRVGINDLDSHSMRKKMLREALAGAGGLADRVAANLDYEHDFYFGPLSQVEASRWSKGRVVLVGDAAYCPTPFTGRGTSLALVGAYVLAGEIKKNKTHSDAFQAYESIVRPYVENGQQLTPRIVRLVHPKSKLGVALIRFVAKLGATKVVQNVFKPSEERQAKASAENFELPTYA